MDNEPIVIKGKCPKCGGILIYQKTENTHAAWCTYVECDYFLDMRPHKRYNEVHND